MTVSSKATMPRLDVSGATSVITGAASGMGAEVARQLARAGDVIVTQKGVVLDPDADWRGPVRIRVRSV